MTVAVHGLATAVPGPARLAVVANVGRRNADLAIETGHLLRLAFGRPWRQTEGLPRSLASLLGVGVGVPDHTTFSRRSPGLALSSSLAERRVRAGRRHRGLVAIGGATTPRSTLVPMAR